MSQPGDRVQIATPHGSLTMEHGLVVAADRLGHTVGEVAIRKEGAEPVVEALALIVASCHGRGVFSHAALPAADGGRIEIEVAAGGPANEAGVYLIAPADSAREEREVVCWVGDEWDEDVLASTATLNAIALALSEGVVAVAERIG